MYITIFTNGLSSLIRHTPKYNVVIIGGDMNAQIGKDKNNEFGLNNKTKRNGDPHQTK